ncbi:MAG: heparinase II/III family protein [Armatimonadetes bacterium]|nr:heparinase II/III family protein [Armatimonadota bacterium]MDW8028458.1 heparinase II/III family protein [Armatimonadota bacterium]
MNGRIWASCSFGLAFFALAFSENHWVTKINREHPRLLVTKGDFERLQKLIQTNSQAREFYQRLKNQAERICQEPTSRYEIPDGLRLLATSRKVLQRIYTLALLYHLDGEKRYLERVWRELEAAANFPDWNPRHFLDTAEMAHAFAIGYDWLYHEWSDEQRKVLRDAMVQKAILPALKVYREKGWWSQARHNWNQVCNGGIGMAALTLLDEVPDLCSETLSHAVQSLQIPMREFAPDGAWGEGPGYWNYATSYNCVFLAALETAIGTDLGLSQMPGFSETGLFPIYITGPTGRTFNFADGGDGTLRAPQMFWLARKFNRPVYAWYARNHASPHPLDLIWFDGRSKDPQAEGLSLDKYFRYVEVATMRTAWNDREAIFVAFKAGDNKFNHSHLDIGSFVLDALGYRWAIDLGADDYNLPGFFGRERWNYYRLRAEGHNTLIINPSSEPDQDPRAEAKIVQFVSQPERAFAIADLTPAYARHGEKVMRGVMLDRKGQFVLVQDEVLLKQQGEIWWFMHTPSNVQISDDGKAAILSQGDAQLRAILVSPEDARFTVMDARPLPTSPDPKGQNPNKGVRKLAVNLKGISSVRLSVMLQPVTETKAEKLPPLIPLDKWAK